VKSLNSWSEDGENLKNLNHHDPASILEAIRRLENAVAGPLVETESREDIPVRIRTDETVGPAMFRPDPLIPGGYLANSLTIRAMRQDIFVLGESLDELSQEHQCQCGQEIDLQFWKLCPFCGRGNLG
jgi:hypothetical protein